MLVLDRTLEQVTEIQVPNGPIIEVMVVRVRGNKVRLGFSAPPEVDIFRKEVADRIRNGEAKGVVK